MAHRLFVTGLLAIFLVGCDSSSTAAGPEVRPILEGLLPADTFAYVHVPNSQARGAEYAKSNLHKLVNHPEVKAFIKPFEDSIGKMIDGDTQVKESMGLSIRELWDLLGGPLELAVFGTQVEGRTMPGVVLALGAEDTSRLREAAGKVKAAFARQPGWEETEKPVGDHTVYSVGTEQQGFHYAVVEETVVASITLVHLEAVLGKGTTGGLPGNTRYADLRKRLTPEGRHLGLVYVGLAPLWAALGDQVPPEARSFMEGLGVLDMPAVGIAVEYDLPHLRERYVFLTDRQDRGLPRLLAGTPGKDPAGALVPGDATAYARMGFSAAEMYDIVKSAVSSQPDMKQGFDEGVKEFHAKFGFDLRNDLFASLGASWTLYSRPTDAPSGQAETVGVVALEDEKKFFGCLEKLSEQEGFPLKPLEGEVKGYFTTFEAPPPDAAPPGGAPFPPGLMMPVEGMSVVLFAKDGRLFVGFTPAAPGDFVKRADGADTNLLANPRFAAIRRKAPAEADAVVMQDLGASVGPLLKVLNALPPDVTAQIKDPETGEPMLDPEKLPGEETLRELLGVSITTKVTEKGAITVESLSDVGATSMSAVFGAGLGAALMLPAISQATQRAKVVSCANNLSQLWKMQNIYMSMYGGRMKEMPKETGSAFWLALSKTEKPLIDESILDIYVCPVMGMPAQPGFTTYLGPKSDVNELPATAIVGACAGMHPDGSILVLRKSGDVIEVTPGDPLYPRVMQETKR